MTHLGRALYQIAHEAGTWDALDDVDGLSITAVATAAISTDALLGPDPDTWPENPFEVDTDRILYGESDVYL